jgi:hypothetical protein
VKELEAFGKSYSCFKGLGDIVEEFFVEAVGEEEEEDDDDEDDDYKDWDSDPDAERRNREIALGAIA